MRSYTEFKDYLASFLWRDGDTVLLNALDALIAMAEAELQRVLKIQDNQSVALLSFTGAPLALPDDYRTLDQLTDASGGYDYLTPALFIERAQSGSIDQRSFTIIGNDLWLSGVAGSGDPNLWNRVDSRWNSATMRTWHKPTSAEAMPHDVNLIYYRKIPSYKATDVSWIAELHLDLLTYATLKHAGRFVRDDDRVPGWKEDYQAALESVIDEDAKQRYSRGGPMKLVVRRQVR